MVYQGPSLRDQCQDVGLMANDIPPYCHYATTQAGAWGTNRCLRGPTKILGSVFSGLLVIVRRIRKGNS